MKLTYATGAACQQRTLTPPDTWSCPTFGLACVLMSRPISPELVLPPDFWISNTPRYFSFASYLYGVFFYYKLYQICRPRPVPTPRPILLKSIRVEPSSDYHGSMKIWGKSVKSCQSYSGTDQVVKKKGKKNNKEEKTERKQKGFRLRSETL